MPFKSKAQMRAIAAKERSGEIEPGTFRRWVDETPRRKDGHLKLPARVKKGYEIPLSQMSSAQSRRRRQSYQSAAYGTAAVGALGAAGTLSAARFTPERSHAAARRGINAVVGGAQRGAATAAPPTSMSRKLLSRKVSPGDKYVALSRWARKSPGKSAAAILGLKGTALAAGMTAKHRADEASGLSFKIGEAKHRRDVSKGWKSNVGTGLATGTIGGILANQLPQTSGRLIRLRSASDTAVRSNSSSVAALEDKRRESRQRRGGVAKSDPVRGGDYPHLRPLPDNGYIRLVRMPADIAAQAASARMMDRAASEALRLQMTNQRRKRGRVTPTQQTLQGRQYIFAPLRGSVTGP